MFVASKDVVNNFKKQKLNDIFPKLKLIRHAAGSRWYLLADLEEIISIEPSEI